MTERWSHLSISNKIRRWAVTSKDTDICCKLANQYRLNKQELEEALPGLRSQDFDCCFPPFKARLRFKNLLILLEGAAEGMMGCSGVCNTRMALDLLNLF
jgi:hypothetical protein